VDVLRFLEYEFQPVATDGDGEAVAARAVHLLKPSPYSVPLSRSSRSPSQAVEPFEPFTFSSRCRIPCRCRSSRSRSQAVEPFTFSSRRRRRAVVVSCAVAVNPARRSRILLP
jgi:hypothetical protein